MPARARPSRREVRRLSPRGSRRRPRRSRSRRCTDEWPLRGPPRQVRTAPPLAPAKDPQKVVSPDVGPHHGKGGPVRPASPGVTEGELEVHLRTLDNVDLERDAAECQPFAHGGLLACLAQHRCHRHQHRPRPGRWSSERAGRLRRNRHDSVARLGRGSGEPLTPCRRPPSRCPGSGRPFCFGRRRTLTISSAGCRLRWRSTLAARSSSPGRARPCAGAFGRCPRRSTARSGALLRSSSPAGDPRPRRG